MSILKYELNIMRDPSVPFIIGYNKQYITKFSPPNWHENIEILYIIKGKGHIQYDAVKYEISQGDLIIVNSEVIHQITSDAPIYFHYLIINRQFCAESGIPSTSLTFQPLIRDAQPISTFLRILETYNHYVQTSAFYEVALIRALLLELLYYLCKNCLISGRDIEQEKKNDAVRSAITYIRSHLSQPITVEDLARHVGVSTYSLARGFKRTIGRTIIDTILLLRCAEAKHLIESGISVTDAAHCCGFVSPSHFTHTFKKYYNALPSHYLPKKQEQTFTG